MTRWNRRGANAVEFALTLPMMFLGIAAVVDYGLYFTERGHIYQATLEGVRAGAVAQDGNANAVAAAEAQCDDVLADFGVTGASCDGSLTTANFEDVVQLDVTYTYNGVVAPLTMPDINFTMAMRLEDP